VQILSDLLVRLSIGDQLKDPLLLGRQAGQLLVLHQVLALSQPVQDAPGDGGVEQAFTLAHRPDRSNQLASPDLLEDVTGRSGHDRREQGLVVRE
jgi:hypothetical protein